MFIALIVHKGFASTVFGWMDMLTVSNARVHAPQRSPMVTCAILLTGAAANLVMMAILGTVLLVNRALTSPTSL